MSSLMAAHLEDVLWVAGVLVCAFACIAYMREAAEDNDNVLVIVAGATAIGFVGSALAYVWWLW